MKDFDSREYESDEEFEKLADEARRMGEIMATAMLEAVEKHKPKQVIEPENLAQVLMFEPGHE